MDNLDIFDTVDASGEEVVEHYGRKGMKWYQNIFGRRQKHAKYNKRVRKKISKAEIRKKAEERKKKAAEKKHAAQVKKWTSDPKQLYKHRRDMSKEEVEAALAEFEWDRKVRKASIGASRDSADYVKNIVDATKTSIEGYNQVARIFNTFSKGKKIPYIQNVPGGGDKKKDKKDDD